MRSPLDRDHWPEDESSLRTGLPLEGVRVLDLSRVLAGPLAAMVVGDLGADVIKVEQPTGDPVRAMGPPWLDGDATYFLAVNRNRRSVIADLTTTEGRELVRRLASSADAVIENFLPSQAESLGVATMRDELSEVVWVTVAPAASGGPLADEPAFDLLAQARSGLMGVSGSEASGPMKAGAPIADVITGLYAAVGLLAGLLDWARAGGPARRIEAPLLESTITALVNQAAGYLATGDAPRLLGNDHPSLAPYGPYSTSDLEILIAAGTESQWQRLVEVLGSPSLAGDERFRTNSERVAHRSELRSELEEQLITADCATWIDRLTAGGVPCAPVNDVPAALQQEQVASGDLIGEVELASGAVTKMVLSPLLVDGRRPGVRLPPPDLGEHTSDIQAKVMEEQ
jgi:crotonobetainyl-CoA:carnitine CoA-transferase CaiB-like acyl-CoA transferase